LCKFDALAIRQHSQATLDVELRHHSPESCFDLVSFKPALIQLLEFFWIRLLFPQKAFRDYPTFVRWEWFCADQSDGAALIVFANAFACAPPANTGTNDEVIASNNIKNYDHSFTRRAPTSEIIRLTRSLLRGCSDRFSRPTATRSVIRNRRYGK